SPEAARPVHARSFASAAPSLAGAPPSTAPLAAAAAAARERGALPGGEVVRRGRPQAPLPVVVQAPARDGVAVFGRGAGADAGLRAAAGHRPGPGGVAARQPDGDGGAADGDQPAHAR